jgi:GrpB-like predicted nucleotidyltransferase (UPF0157 family)
MGKTVNDMDESPGLRNDPDEPDGAGRRIRAIEVVPYNDVWPLEFLSIGFVLRNAFGEHAVAIHHIGATSVPGLCSKDAIDIQVTVADLTNPALTPALEALCLPWWSEELFFDHTPPGMTLPKAELVKRMAFTRDQRPVYVHLRVEGRFNQRYPLLCRDYLRSHPLAADAFGELKFQLARRFPDDVESYFDIKDPAFDIIMVGAEAWAADTGWQPGPSDA